MYINYTANVCLLLLFAATGESMLSGKRKKTESAASTSAASSSSTPAAGLVLPYVPSKDMVNSLIGRCFADILVHELGEKTKMGGKSNKKLFVLNPLSVDRETLRAFMQENEGKAAELWNCVDRARPFPHKNVDGLKKLANLMDIFRNEITRMAEISPSDYIQEKLHNAQCLVDLGVIQGKVLMEKPEKSENYYEPAEESEWFQMLKQFGKDHLPIELSKEGNIHLNKCVHHKDKPFAVEMETKRQKSTDEHLQMLLNSIGRGELLKIAISKQVPFSDWLLKKIRLNQKQKQCFADVFLSHFERQVKENSDQQLLALEGDFPEIDKFFDLLINEEDHEVWKTFVACLQRACPYPRHLHNPKHVHHLMYEFYDQLAPKQSIPLSQKMQQKMHNAQCWLDLGALEGKLSMALIQPGIGMYTPEDQHQRREAWKRELESTRSIVVSTEGKAHMDRCLHKGAPFEAKFEKIAPFGAKLEKIALFGTRLEKIAATANQWHLQLLKVAERSDLLKASEQISHSEWLNKEIFYEQNCVADFLIRHWHVPTRLGRYIGSNLTSAKLWRKIVWSYLGQTHVYRRDNTREFETLEICLVRKALFLRWEPQGGDYIDLGPLFQVMGYGIFTTPSLTKELDIQSECLDNFLAIKSHKDQPCLLKERRGLYGEQLAFDPGNKWIIDYDSKGAYALSARMCLLPEEESGIYVEKDSENGKENEDFKQLWDCGVRMTTMEQGGKKAINIRNLQKIHTPEQRYLRGNLMEIFFSTEVTLDKDDVCPICLGEYAQDGRNVVSTKRCKHHFHSHCIKNWMRRGNDSCPMCKGPITNIPRDPDGTFDVMIGSPND